MNTRAAFSKHLILYKRPEILGANVIASGDEDSHHHRKGVASAFGERSDTLVYEEPKRVVSISLTCGRPKGNGVRLLVVIWPT